METDIYNGLIEGQQIACKLLIDNLQLEMHDISELPKFGTKVIAVCKKYQNSEEEQMCIAEVTTYSHITMLEDEGKRQEQEEIKKYGRPLVYFKFLGFAALPEYVVCAWYKLPSQ